MSARAGIALLAAVLSPLGGTAHRKTEEGNRHYIDERLDEALRSYTEAQVAAPDAPQLFYDIGNVLYRQGDYAGAEELFQRALSAAPPELVPDAAYNLGNARFRQEAYDEAVEAYRRTLEARPDDADAKRNLELALRQLQQQQQQQQQQEQGNQDEENDQREQQEQQEDGSGEQDRQQGQEPGDRDPQEDGQGQPRPERGESQEGPRDRPGQMSRQEAERLLDSLENQERENLRKAQMRRKQQTDASREVDW
jgi:Ca-activated chloride channel family protein